MNSGNETQDRDKLHARNLDHKRQKVARGRHREEALRTRRVLCVGKSHAKSAHSRNTLRVRYCYTHLTTVGDAGISETS